MAICLNASVRNAFGRGASRRLRRAGEIPAIIVARGDEPAVSIVLNEEKLILAMLKDEFYKETVTLQLDGKELAVRPVAAQRHPVTSRVIHLDFQRV